MRLGYLGPAGTHSHAALLAAPQAAGAQAIPYATERETIFAAQDGQVDAALVPIENSLEGGVNATLDALAFEAAGVRIVGEQVLPVSHALMARPAVALEDVQAVLSHPQALGQCRRWLETNLPGRRAMAATSTAEAVRTAAAAAEPWAAIGTTAAAALHGCAVLAEGIEDEHGNATRFLWLARPGAPWPVAPADDAPWKSSIVFWGAGDAAPGWLVRCLSELAFRGINLTRIESRPLKRALGHYFFLVDLEGREDDPGVTDAIQGLRLHCEEVRVLGSYPAAAGAPAG